MTNKQLNRVELIDQAYYILDDLIVQAISWGEKWELQSPEGEPDEIYVTRPGCGDRLFSWNRFEGGYVPTPYTLASLRPLPLTASYRGSRLNFDPISRCTTIQTATGSLTLTLEEALGLSGLLAAYQQVIEGR